MALGFQLKAVMVAKLIGFIQAGRAKTDTMGAHEAKPLTNAAGVASDRINFTAIGNQLSAGSALNNNTATYVVLASATTLRPQLPPRQQ